MPLLVPLAVAVVTGAAALPGHAPPTVLLGIALVLLGAARLIAGRFGPLPPVALVLAAAAAAAGAAATLGPPILQPLPAPGATGPAVGVVRWRSTRPDAVLLGVEPLPAEEAVAIRLAPPLTVPVNLRVEGTGADVGPDDRLLLPPRAARAAEAAFGWTDPSGSPRWVRVTAAEIAVVAPAGPADDPLGLGAARRHVGRALHARAPEAEIPGRALLLGEASRVPANDRDPLRTVGVAHLLAVSGFHLGLATWALIQGLSALFVLLGRWTLRWDVRRPVAALVLPALWLAVEIAGRSPSAVRAALMASLLFGARLLGRRATPLGALAFAAVAVTLADPGRAAEPGFRLSLAAVAGLLVGDRVARCRLEDRPAAPSAAAFRRRKPRAAPLGPVRRTADALGRWVFRAFVASLFVALATAPVAVLHFGSLPTASPVANLLAVPWFVFVVFPATAIAALLAAGPAPDALVEPFARVAGAAWEALVALCDGLAAVLPSPLELSPASAPAVAAVCTMLGILVGARGVPRRVAAIALLAVAVLRGDGAPRLAGVPPPPPAGAAAAHFLPVGDADATLLRLPDGTTVLIDGGGAAREDGLRVADERLIPHLRRHGVRRIDLLVVTHPHPDHWLGARAAAERYPVDELWITPQGEAESPDSPFARWVAAMARHGTRVRRTPTICGTHEIGGAGLEVLHPCGTLGFDPALEQNDNSLVIRVSVGCADLLLAGDVEADAEARLVEAGLPEAELLKVPHHGSRTSSTPPFLDRVRPIWAVVPGNVHPPGHRGPPHADALRRIEDAGAEVRILGRDDAVTVHLAPHELRRYDADGRPAGRVEARCAPADRGTMAPAEATR